MNVGLLVPAAAAHLDLHGRRIAVATDRPDLDALVREQWGRYVIAGAAPHAGLDAVFHVADGGHARVREWQFFNNGQILVIADDRRLITASFHQRPWQVHIQTFGQTDRDAYYYLLEPILLMVLARLNLLHWHSAAVALDHAGVLIVGVSGSGKSTTTLNLLRAGFAFVADDEVFLERRDAGVAAIGIDTSLYATDRTLAMYPELADLQSAPQVPRGQGLKRQVPVRDRYRGHAGDPPTVRAVLFPTVVPDAPTALQPIGAADVVRRFLTHTPKEYPTLVTDAAAAQARLDTFAALATGARGFEVTLGRDADRLPDLVKAYLR